MSYTEQGRLPSTLHRLLTLLCVSCWAQPGSPQTFAHPLSSLAGKASSYSVLTPAGPASKKRCTSVSSPFCLAWILLKGRIPHTRKRNQRECGWIRSAECNMSPPCAKGKQKSPSTRYTLPSKHPSRAREGWSAPSCFSHSSPEQQSTPAFKAVKQSHPDLGGEGAYMNFCRQKQAPSASNSSDPSDACLRSSWITLWRFPFLLVRHKRSKAPVVTSSSIKFWFLDALSWSRNISPLVGKVVEKRWVAAVAFLGNVRYYMTC